MSNFDIAFNRTMQNEGLGILTNDKLDRGGQTFSGISRVYWPTWEGWKLVDSMRKTGAADPALLEMVKSFYKINFWDRIHGDVLSELSLDIACELFDSAVNMDVSQAVRFLQAGFNVGSGEDEIIVDGRLGPTTIDRIKKYLSSRPGSTALNEEILLNCMNGEQYIFYKNNPQHKRYRGWFRRV